MVGGMDELERAQQLFARLTGDLAQAELERARVRALYPTLAAHHQHNADVARAAMRRLAPSGLSLQYLDDVNEAHLAQILAARSGVL